RLWKGKPRIRGPEAPPARRELRLPRFGRNLDRRHDRSGTGLSYGSSCEAFHHAHVRMERRGSRPRGRRDRHCHGASRAKYSADLAKTQRLVGDVLQGIQAEDEVKRVRSKGQVFAGATQNLAILNTG